MGVVLRQARDIPSNVQYGYVQEPHPPLGEYNITRLRSIKGQALQQNLLKVAKCLPISS
jgi:hypothetical protein